MHHRNFHYKCIAPCNYTVHSFLCITLELWQKLDVISGIGDACDNCYLVPNSDQIDSNNNGRGDVCENDFDSDGVQDSNDVCPYNNLIFDTDFTGSDTFELDKGSAAWNIQKTSITETANCCTPLAIGKAQFTSVDFNGKMKATSDDDPIGFVFGFQDIQNFYVFYGTSTVHSSDWHFPWRLVQVESTNVTNLNAGMKFILNWKK